MFGASQWLAMWKRHRTGVLWVAASAAALGVGMTLGVILVETLGRALTGEPMRLFTMDPARRFLGLVVIGAVTGLFLGCAQRIVLWHYRATSHRWIVRSFIAFAVGLPAGSVAARWPVDFRARSASRRFSALRAPSSASRPSRAQHALHRG